MTTPACPPMSLSTAATRKQKITTFNATQDQADDGENVKLGFDSDENQ